MRTATGVPSPVGSFPGRLNVSFLSALVGEFPCHASMSMIPPRQLTLEMLTMIDNPFALTVRIPCFAEEPCSSTICCLEIHGFQTQIVDRLSSQMLTAETSPFNGKMPVGSQATLRLKRGHKGARYGRIDPQLMVVNLYAPVLVDENSPPTTRNGNLLSASTER